MLNGIYDAHVHLGPSGEWLPYMEPSVTTDEVISAMDEHDVEKAVVFPNPLPGDKYPDVNEMISQAVDAHPKRLVGFGRVDPRRGMEAVKEVERCIDLGLEGIKLHPFVETYRPDHPNFSSLFDKIHDEGIALLTHTGGGFSSPGYMNKVLEEREDMNIILGHLNEGCISVADNYENVYADTSGTRVYMLEHACERIPEKVVFGSDFPYLNYIVQKSVVEASDIDDSIKERIFRKNLEEFLKGLK